MITCHPLQVGVPTGSCDFSSTKDIAREQSLQEHLVARFTGSINCNRIPQAEKKG
jgi:hypothetical protein